VTTEAREARRRIGLLPEGFGPYENLSAREHVVSAIETKSVDDDPDAIIERVGLDPEDARRPAGEYSTGMAQRMALAVALVGDPDLLMLDEPSSGLDPNGVSLLRRIIREEVERGATVFFSSHILDEVERVCDRVGIMRGGELVAVSTVDDLRSELDAGATVTATLDRAPDALSLTDVDGVTDATVDGTTVAVSCARPDAKMRALRRLDDAATVEDIAVEDASLATLFEAYTEGTGPSAGAEQAAAGEDTTPDGDSSADGDTATAATGGASR
jgi:ABC-2 type transport system ATP-binding protein